MYDFPELRDDADRDWRRLSSVLRAAGIDAPVQLVRCNADLPPVPGGIRDLEKRLIAPDPATLPPDELDLATLWRHPALLLAQTCWGPMEAGLQEHVQVIGQPDYSEHEGGQGPLYSSAILMRQVDVPPFHAASGAQDIADATREPGFAIEMMRGGAGWIVPPATGASHIPLKLLRSRRLAYNELNSMSGFLALERDLERSGERLCLFSERIETGSHRASVRAVAEGRADVCAVDCRTWTLMRRFEPASGKLAVVGWTARRPGLPFVTSRFTAPQHMAILRQVLPLASQISVLPNGRTRSRFEQGF